MPLVFSTSSVGTLWFYSWLGQYLSEGSFWIIVVFSLAIHSSTSVFCMHLFISVESLSCMEVNFETKVRVCQVFIKLAIFSKCCLYVQPIAFFEHSQLCFYAVYPLGFFSYDLSVPIFCSKIICLSRIQLLVWLCPFSPELLVNF